MALISCPECKKRISDTAGICPKCGYQLIPEKIAEAKRNEKQVKKGCAIGCLSVIAVFFVLWLTGPCRQNSQKQEILQSVGVGQEGRLNSKRLATIKLYSGPALDAYRDVMGATDAEIAVMVRNGRCFLAPKYSRCECSARAGPSAAFSSLTAQRPAVRAGLCSNWSSEVSRWCGDDPKQVDSQGESPMGDNFQGFTRKAGQPLALPQDKLGPPLS